MTLGAIIAVSSALIWPFPDRLSAYVWRNWTIVPKERLARDAGNDALMRVLASRELETAKEAMKELCRDPRNAYERSNGYYYNLQDLREKILGCSLIAAGER